MAVPDLSSYKVAGGETTSATKFDGLVDALGDSLNNVGDPTKTTWAPGQILLPSQLKQGGASARRGLVWSGTAWVPAAIADLTVKTVTATVDVNNTTTETDLFTGTTGSGYLVIPGGSLVAAGGIRVVAGGDYLNNSGAGRTIRLKLRVGTAVALPSFTTWTPLWDSGVSDSITANANKRGWNVDIQLQALNSTSSQNASGTFELSSATAATVGLGPLIAPTSSGLFGVFSGVATSVDYTVDTGLVLSVIHSSASSSLSMRTLYARVEVSSA